MPTTRRATTPDRPALRNRILSALPKPELARLWPRLEHIELLARRVLYDIDTPMTHVYFLETGVASVVAAMSDGRAVETATVGYEGMVGLAVFLGGGQMTAQCFCQIPGNAYRLPSSDLRRHVASGGELPRLLNRYTQAMLVQIAQASGCNRMHSVRHRCARWLLLSHDRMNEDSFPLKRQFLSQMLGVQRTTVNAAARALERTGSISYRHDVITIRDRALLERQSCECYAIIRAEFARLFEHRMVPSVFEIATEIDGETTLKGGAPVEDPNEVGPAPRMRRRPAKK